MRGTSRTSRGTWNTLPDTPTPTVADIQAALRDFATGRECAYFPEFRMGTGYTRDDAKRRIDGLAVPHYMHRSRNGVMAFEIKVSRADYAREIRDPTKYRAALAQSHEFYYVSPAGVLNPCDLLLVAGLIEVHANINGKPYAHVSVPAFHRDDVTPTWAFVASLMARAREVAT